MRSFAVAALVAVVTMASSAHAFTPRIGIWHNPAEPGTGYAIDIQNGLLVLAIYSYQAGGAAQWYLAAGPMRNDNHGFAATLDRYQNGKCISCPFKQPAALQGNEGVVNISFRTEVSATVTVGGRFTNIEPFDFGYGPLPDGLLGEWVFFYDTDIFTSARRFNFTSTAAGTATGTGLAMDTERAAGCELQTSGGYAGMVICVVLGKSGKAAAWYVFLYGIDETFSGLLIFPEPSALNPIPMKGLRTRSKTGTTRSLEAAAPDATLLAPLISLGIREVERALDAARQR